jgi:pimeloyl-ACP methyl ester carboxylesterase
MILANSDENTNTRRSFLRGAAGAAAAVTGATAFSGTAAAVEVEDNPDSSLPVEDELLLYVHGWFGEFRTETPDGELQRLSENLSQGSYSPSAEVSYTWGAFLSDINYFSALESTEDVGGRLATKIKEFYDNGGGNIRLVGHSLGAPVVLHALNQLGSEYTVETVALLAGATPQESVCGNDWSFGWDFTDGIETGAETIRNYHSTSDWIILWNLFTSFADSDFDLDFDLEFSIGFSGLVDGCSHSNWTDVDCTDAPRESILVHFDYFDSRPIGENMASTFNGSSPETVITGNEYELDLGIYELEVANPFAGYTPKIMEVDRAGEFEGANVRLWEDWDRDNQAWKIEEVEQGGYRIAAQHTDMVLAPQFGELEAGTTLVQEVWRDQPHQRWMVEPVGNKYVFRNIGSGLIAEADGSAPVPAGADIRLNERHSGYGGDYHEEWELNPVWNDVEPGIYEIENKNSGKIMEVDRAGEFEGANVRQWDDWDRDNQAWEITEAEQGGYRVTVQHTGMVLTARDEGTEQGTTLVQEEWRDSPHQRWLIQDVDGDYKMRNIGSGLVADVEGASTDRGADIHLWEWHGGDNQRWNLNPV